MTTRLRCTDLSGGHGATTVFRGIDLAVDAGRVLAVLGPNGAGKTTLLLTIAGLLPSQFGTVHVDERPIRNGSGTAANRAGVVLVPDSRCLFPSLTVAENLRVARSVRGSDPRRVLDLFPWLEARWEVRARSLSGGEQQMLALARALVQDPKVLLVDEPSMGLAPRVVESLFATLERAATEQDCAVVLVEQYVSLALALADDAAVLNHGSIVLRIPASELAAQPDLLEQAYFGDEAPVA